MLTVLVTGKNGQLALCIKSVTEHYSNLKFIFKSSSELDITNNDEVQALFSVEEFDYCINCAAYTNVDQAEKDRELAYNVNVSGAKNLAESCLKYQVTLVHISTDFVFDGNGLIPYTENSITNPLGVYGKTKLEGENVISETLNNHFILRTSWLYSEFGNNFLKTMLRLANERDELGVVSDQIGSPTYAIDLAKAILSIIESQSTSYGIYHYSNTGVISWYDFAKEIFRLSESSVKLNKIETKDFPTLATRPKYSVLDTSKIKQAINIDIPNWKESLSKAILNLSSIDHKY